MTVQGFDAVQTGVVAQEQINRWAVRCVDCLSVAFVETAPPSRWEAQIICGCCGGAVETMGRVSRKERLTENDIVSVCDARCTEAGGPLCVCKCACVNHGSRRVKEIERDLGGVPRLMGIPENAKAVADAWREAYSALEGALVATLRSFPEGWISDRTEWERKNRVGFFLRSLYATKAMRTQKSRLTKLTKIHEMYKGMGF